METEQRVWSLTCIDAESGDFACAGVFRTLAGAQAAMQAEVESTAGEEAQYGKPEIREHGAEIVDQDGCALIEWAIGSHVLGN
jgi:hypothetical protein